MAGQRPGDAADLGVGRARQELLLDVAHLPESGYGKGKKRQSPTRSFDGGDHLVHQRFVLEPVATPRGRLDQCAAQPVARHRLERGQGVDDSREGARLEAAHQEVVAEREEDVDVRLASEPAEERGERRLGLGRIEGEELLELVDDDEGVVAPPPPAREKFESRPGIIEVQELSQSLRIVGELGREGLSQATEGRVSRRRHDRRPTLRSRGDDARADERGLARARGSDQGEKASLVELPPERRDFLLPPEEAPRVRLGEGREARVGALLLDVRERRGAAACEDRFERRREVLCRRVPLLASLLEASADDPLDTGEDVGQSRRESKRRLVDDRRQRRRDGRPPEGVLAGQKLVEHDPSEKTSERGSTPSAAICSGDM